MSTVMINCQQAMEFYIRVSLTVNTEVGAKIYGEDLERFVQTPPSNKLQII